MSRKLIVTHHAPDLDAIGATWLLKRFDAQHYADAHVGFVNPGETITLEEAEEFGCQLHEVTHVDTGLGDFDHHQPERGHEYISATSLVYDYACQIHPELKDDKALATLVEYITETDHFGEIYWPDSGSSRYMLMLHELVKGSDSLELHNDESQMHFGIQCLDAAHGLLTEYHKAAEILDEKGETFEASFGKCLAIETRNDATIKMAQKRGYMLVIRKDPEEGHIRIKARPDAQLDLKDAADAIKKADTKGTWYYHPSGKMLMNGSRKHRNQVASPLSLTQVTQIIKDIYA
jgi:hypothetical protein